MIDPIAKSAPNRYKNANSPYPSAFKITPKNSKRNQRIAPKITAAIKKLKNNPMNPNEIAVASV